MNKLEQKDTKIKDKDTKKDERMEAERKNIRKLER